MIALRQPMIDTTALNDLPLAPKGTRVTMPHPEMARVCTLCTTKDYVGRFPLTKKGEVLYYKNICHRCYNFQQRRSEAIRNGRTPPLSWKEFRATLVMPPRPPIATTFATPLHAIYFPPEPEPWVTTVDPCTTLAVVAACWRDCCDEGPRAMLRALAVVEDVVPRLFIPDAKRRDLKSAVRQVREGEMTLSQFEWVLALASEGT